MALGCTVVSLVPFHIYEEKPGLFPPRYEIKASNMKTPELLPIKTAYHYVYLDQDRKSLRIPDPPDLVAKAIVDDYVTSQLGVDENARPALFWLPDEVTPEVVVLKHKETMNWNLLLQKQWMLNVSRLADNDWNRYHQHNVVSDFQRQCAIHIGWKPEDHEWMIKPMEETIKCPACMSPVPAGAIICAVCKNVLDAERAKAKNLKFLEA